METQYCNLDTDKPCLCCGCPLEILPTARNLTGMIREVYKKRDNTDAKPEPADGKDKQDDIVVGQVAKPNQDTAAERDGPSSRTGTPVPVAATNNAPVPTVMVSPTGGDGLHTGRTRIG